MDGLNSAQMDTLLDRPGAEEGREAHNEGQTVAKASLTSAQIEMLLDKLSSDDDYRALLLSDPATALQQIGAPMQVADCFRQCKKLADTETLKASRAAIQRQLGLIPSANIHDLRAG